MDKTMESILQDLGRVQGFIIEKEFFFVFVMFMLEEWTDSPIEGEMGNRRKICEIKTDNGEMINENLTVKSDENRRNKVEKKKEEIAGIKN